VDVAQPLDEGAALGGEQHSGSVELGEFAPQGLVFGAELGATFVVEFAPDGQAAIVGHGVPLVRVPGGAKFGGAEPTA
jgi:hypothetical protein